MGWSVGGFGESLPADQRVRCSAAMRAFRADDMLLGYPVRGSPSERQTESCCNRLPAGGRRRVVVWTEYPMRGMNSVVGAYQERLVTWRLLILALDSFVVVET